MSKNSSQKGSAIVVIIIVLVVAIVGVLGFILWQNFFSSKTASVIPEVTEEGNLDQAVLKEKTFTSDKYGITFTYPAGWTVKQTLAEDQYNYVRSYSIQRTEEDSLTLSVGSQGIGGTCDYSAVRSNNVVEAEPVSIKSQKPVTLSYIIYQDTEGYVGAYGLTDYYTEVKDSPSCPNVFYMFIPSTNPNLYLIGFGGSKKFSSFEDAQQFKDSDVYKQYKKIISSLTYQD